MIWIEKKLKRNVLDEQTLEGALERMEQGWHLVIADGHVTKEVREEKK